MNQENLIFEMQAELLHSMAHPLRLRIVHLLKDGPRSVNEISTALGSTQSSVSRNLAVLRSTGLLTAHRRGAEVFYEITNPKVVEVCEMMRKILAERESMQMSLFDRFRE